MFGSKNKKPRRKKNAFLDILNGLLTLVVIGLLVIGGLFIWGVMQFYAEGPVPEDTSFYVEQGDGLNSVANKLERDGLITNSWIFRIGTRALDVDTAIPQGEFAISAHASMADILRQITQGKPIEYTVTIPEGFTSWQVVQRLKGVDELVGDIAEVPAEGSLMPDTYHFERGDDRNDIIARMQEAQSKALAEIWENRDPELPLETPEQLVTLASIVEKETGVAGERPQVAAVFVNRLRKNMRLQSDPTIIYGITHGEGSLGRGLRKSEIEEKTPYNTYQIDGLPPGPIANPGRDALEATANPADSKALYFVAAGPVPSDGHLFADTYAEHRKNVAKYRAIEREAAAAEAAAEAEAARSALEQEQAEQEDDGEEENQN